MIENNLPSIEYVCPFCGARLVNETCPNGCQDRIIIGDNGDNGDNGGNNGKN